MSELKYTQEQLDIAVLKNNESHIFTILQRLEAKVDSHFHWTLGLIFGVYGLALTGLIGALGHAYGWF
jgi:hypothetical protein